MIRTVVAAGLMGLAAVSLAVPPARAETRMEIPMTIELPPPTFRSEISLEQTLATRRSVRRFSEDPLHREQIGRLLWAAQGVTHSAGYRTAPSAGALYPLELFVVAGAVSDLPAGVYRYRPREHVLLKVAEGDRRAALAAAALGQGTVGRAPAILVFCAVYERIVGKYGERGERYAHMEAGHAAQNVHLQAVALGLGSVPVGAFREEGVRASVGAEADETPIYLVPVGREAR
jgi:SagB-type dehydrogenase family enzyme